MKKLLAILLAMMLVMVSAFALAGGMDEENPENNQEQQQTDGQTDGQTDDQTPTGTTPAATTAATAHDPSAENGQDATTATTVTVNKHFNITGAGAKLPAQTVSFTVGNGTVANSTTVTSAPPVTIDSVTFTETNETDDLTKTVTIHLPAYSGVGVYTYPVTETNTNIAGESYASNLELKVTVVQGTSGLTIGGIALRQNNVKTDTMENDYAANALTVGKTVSGNMGDQSKYFPITVVLTAPDDDKVFGSVGVTITGDGATVKDGTTDITTTIAAETAGWTTKTLSLSLKHGQTVKFDNLPKGVTYTVVEDDTITHQDIEGNPDAYAVTGEVEATIALNADATVTINNDKTQVIDTGVTLETSAYVLIMALALAGFAMMAIRRREEY